LEKEMEIKVRNISGYKEVKIATRECPLMLSSLLDEGEAVSFSRQFISATEDLLPADFDVEMKKLTLNREGLEA